MRRITATLAVVGALLFNAGSAWADFDDGLDAYERGEAACERTDYATALQEWLPVAEMGSKSAQFYLGVTYRKGHGVPQNDAEAVRWWQMAAERIALFHFDIVEIDHRRIAAHVTLPR